MKTLKSLFVALLFVLGAVPAFAQTATTFTTLSSAVSDSTSKVVVLASATGISKSTVSQQYYILVENELMKVQPDPNGVTLPSGTFAVIRGYGSTFATPHASGSVVIFGQVGQFNASGSSGVFISGNPPRGKCTAANSAYLPVAVIDNTKRMTLANCNNSTWVEQSLPNAIDANLARYTTVPVGSVAYASMGTNTTTVAGTTWFASIYIPKTTVLTGISVLNGVTVGTDKWMVVLYRADGVPVANSATAGVTSAGANAFQDIPFTSTYLATGPGRYWVAMQTNGTTDTIRTVAASTFVDVLGNAATGTFGTIINPITVPTTLTANKAPIAAVY